MPLLTTTLPSLSDLGPEPILGEPIYESRIARLRRRMKESGLDAVLVYADREHYANVSYLTGFDPRFEEALLVIRSEGAPTILAGNECLSFCEQAGMRVTGVLCQSLSLPTQDRSVRRRVADGLAEAGLLPNERVGIVGWKTIPRLDAPGGNYALAVPQFVVGEVEGYLSAPVVDATPLLCGLESLRAVNEADQLALHEHRATRASQCVWRALESLEPGLTEFEIAGSMGLLGLPQSCHVMCTSGADGVNGLSSPTDREIRRGDRFSTAVGFWGGLCCRAGLVAWTNEPEVDGYVERFVEPYFRAVCAWYETVRVGVTGGTVARAVEETLEPSTVRPLLNAGHMIHLDEWFDSPFTTDGNFELGSGTALQCDIIPTSGVFPGDVSNAEDSLALADADLKAEVCERFPQMWERASGRRRFMTELLGVDLSEDVLLFSDRQGALAPALLSPDTILTK